MALVASNTVIIPLQTEFFALEGVSQLIKTIERVKQNLNKSLDIQGVILTMYDKEISFVHKLKVKQEDILMIKFINL